jgi:hypothetical protein
MRSLTGTLIVSAVVVAFLGAPSYAQDPMAPPPPAATTYRPPVENGQKETGFAFEVHLGSQLLSIGNGGNNLLTLGTLQGGIFAGFKLGRLIVGLGFDIERIASGRSQTMQQDTSQAATAILFTPGVRFALLRSADHRVELFGQFDIGFGTSFNSQSPPPMGTQPDTSNFRITYDVGPGLRFWAAPQFALGAFVGLNGDFTTSSTTVPGTTTTQTTGLTGIAAALQALGVF